MRRLFEYLLVLYSLTGTISIAISQGVMAGGALVAALAGRRKIAWRRTGLEVPVAAWTAAALFATVLAVEPLESFGKMRKLVLFAIAWWAPAVATSSFKLGRLYTALLFAAGTTSLYGVLTFFLHGGPELAVRIDGFHGFYLTNSGLLLLCTFPAVLFTVCPRLASSHRWGAGLASVSILAVQLLGRLPGAWLGTAAGFLFLAYRRRSPALAGVVVAAAVVLLVAPGVFQEASRDMLDPGSHANLERARVWSNGLRLFLQDPISGAGLQDLRNEYARVKAPGDPDAGHMESVPVQIAASMGVPGIVAFAWLVITLFRRLRTARRDTGDEPFLRSIVDGAEAGLVGFLAAGLLEWNFGDSEILALLFFLVGTAIAAGNQGPRAASAA